MIDGLHSRWSYIGLPAAAIIAPLLWFRFYATVGALVERLIAKWRFEKMIEDVRKTGIKKRK